MNDFKVERGFNIMGSIRGKDKWLLNADSLDGLMKIRIDGRQIWKLQVFYQCPPYYLWRLCCKNVPSASNV